MFACFFSSVAVLDSLQQKKMVVNWKVQVDRLPRNYKVFGIREWFPSELSHTWYSLKFLTWEPGVWTVYVYHRRECIWNKAPVKVRYSKNRWIFWKTSTPIRAGKIMRNSEQKNIPEPQQIFQYVLRISQEWFFLFRRKGGQSPSYFYSRILSSAMSKAFIAGTTYLVVSFS